MGPLLNSVFNHSADILGKATLQVSYVIADFLSNLLLNLFDFGSISSIVIDLPGLEGADIALSYMAFGIAMILFAIGIYQYFLSPRGSRDGVVMQIGRIAIVCFFIGNATAVIEKVLNISYKIFILARDSNGDVAQLKGDTFDKLAEAFTSGDRTILNITYNALLDWSVVGFIMEVIFLLIILWNVLKLWLKMFERYVNFIVELYLFPVTVSFMANASMQDVFFTYLRALISQYMILLLNIFFAKVALLNIVNGFLIAMVNENNIYTLFLFSLAFIKIALKMEELIHTWGLFGMSAGSVLDDAREILQVARDGAIYMSNFSGGKGVIGKVGNFAKSTGSSIANSKIGRFLPGTFAGHAVVGAAKGAANGFRTGEGVAGKLKGALSGALKGTVMNPADREKMTKKWNETKKTGAAVEKASLLKGATADEAKQAGRKAINDIIAGRTSSTASEIKQPRTQNGSLHSMAEDLCKSNANGFVSKKQVSADAKQQKEDLSRKIDTTEAMSLVGGNGIESSKLGSCMGGTYNEATGTASLTYCKINEEGGKEYTQATAIPLNDTDDGAAGYSPQLNKLMDSSDIKFTESISDDGQKWAIIPDKSMPPEIKSEMDSRLSNVNTAINTDFEEANKIIKTHNYEKVDAIMKSNPQEFIQCDKNGSNVKFCGKDELAAEAFLDYSSKNNQSSSYDNSSDNLDEAAKAAYQTLSPDQKTKLQAHWSKAGKTRRKK